MLMLNRLILVVVCTVVLLLFFIPPKPRRSDKDCREQPDNCKPGKSLSSYLDDYDNLHLEDLPKDKDNK